MRKIFWTVLFLCSVLSFSGTAHAGNLNWCGIYFEEQDRAFLVVSVEDVASGSKNCSVKDYRESTTMLGSAVMPIDFSKNRSKIGHWRKFSRHFIEIRGKIRNNKITNARLIRDYGA